MGFTGKLNPANRSLHVVKKFHMLVAVGNSGAGAPLRLGIGLKAICGLAQFRDF